MIKDIIKRLLCVMLCAVMVFSCMGTPVFAERDLTEAQVTEKVEAYMKAIDIGTKKYWRKNKSKDTLISNVKKGDYTSCLNSKATGTSNRFGGIQCNGFARYMRYVVFRQSGGWNSSDYMKSKLTKSSAIKCGDILRIKGSSEGSHYVFVYKITLDRSNYNNDKIYYIDCNWDNECGIAKHCKTRENLWKVLYSVWGCAPTKIGTLTYNANGGTGDMSKSSQSLGGSYSVNSRSVTLKKCSFKNSGKYFLGWDTNPNATSPRYKAGSTYRVQGDTVMYAIWGDQAAYIKATSTVTSTNLKLTVGTGGADVFSIPGSTADYSASTLRGTLPSGTEITVKKIYKNPKGDYWYKAESSAGDCFVSPDDISKTAIASDCVYMQDKWSPGTIKQGKSKALSDKILTKSVKITAVKGKISDSKGHSSTKTVSDLNASSYTMKGSPIDKSLKFSTMKAGKCTYTVTATVSAKCIKNGALTTVSKTFTVRSCTFTVTK